MKKKYNTAFGLIGIVLLLGIGFYIWIIIGRSNPNPTRFNNIPESSVWIGGTDGGYWFNIIDIDSINKIYRFRIYNDYNGELVLDANFVKDSVCNNKLPLNKSVLKEIKFFDFDKIVLLNNCMLIMIKPAYGGVFWEIDKGIKNKSNGGQLPVPSVSPPPTAPKNRQNKK